MHYYCVIAPRGRQNAYISRHKGAIRKTEQEPYPTGEAPGTSLPPSIPWPRQRFPKKTRSNENAPGPAAIQTNASEK